MKMRFGKSFEKKGEGEKSFAFGEVFERVENGFAYAEKVEDSHFAK